MPLYLPSEIAFHRSANVMDQKVNFTLVKLGQNYYPLVDLFLFQPM